MTRMIAVVAGFLCLIARGASSQTFLPAAALDTDNQWAAELGAGFIEVAAVIDHRRIQLRLMEAIWKGDLAGVRTALDLGASPTEQWGECSPLSAAILAPKPVRNIKIVRLLLDLGADPAMYTDTGLKQTLLMTAAGSGFCDAASLLIDFGDNLEIHDATGRTALAHAAFSGQADCAKVLLDKGAQVDARDSKKRTPLFDAAVYGHTDVARVLLSHRADPIARDEIGDTPLMVTTYGAYLETAKLLIAHGADPKKARDFDGRTTLMIIGENDGRTSEYVEYMLEQGVDPHTQEKSGATAVVSACYNENPRPVALLISRGVDVNAVYRSSQINGLMIAAERGHNYVVELLLKNKADPNAHDWEGKTALQRAEESNHPTTAALLKKYGAKE